MRSRTCVQHVFEQGSCFPKVQNRRLQMPFGVEAGGSFRQNEPQGRGHANTCGYPGKTPPTPTTKCTHVQLQVLERYILIRGIEVVNCGGRRRLHPNQLCIYERMPCPLVQKSSLYSQNLSQVLKQRNR